MSPAPASPEPPCRGDLLLVRDVVAGRPGAVDRLAERLRCVPRILAAHNARLGRPLDQHDLADLSQDTLVLIWRKLTEYEGRSELVGWVYRICALQSLNAMRAKRRRRGVALTEDVEPSMRCSGRDEEEEIQLGLSRVPDDEAEIIRLKHYEDVSLREIAERLGQPASSVKSRYYRGLRRLEGFLVARRGGKRV